MKISLSYLVLFLISFMANSCGNMQEEKPSSPGLFVSSDTGDSIPPKTQWDNKDTGNLPPQHTKKIHHSRDPKTGLVVWSMEFPSKWTVISKPLYITDTKFPNFLYQMKGPNGFMAFNTPIKAFVDYHNPQMSWPIQQNMSSKLRPVAEIGQLFAEEVAPRMQKNGFKKIGNRNLPAIESMLQDKLKEVTHPVTNRLLATEWEDGKGKKALTVIVQTVFRAQLMDSYMDHWSYGVDYVFSDVNAFETTISDYTHAVTSRKSNAQWEQYQKQVFAQRSAAQQQRHNNVMSNQRAQFQAHQEKMKGIWAAQDASHAAFMDQNFGSSSDRSQRDFVNMIHEEETVTNPYSGENYQIEAGARQYWMDSEGNYIKNNDLFYNPNGDINLNNREWARVE